MNTATALHPTAPKNSAVQSHASQHKPLQSEATQQFYKDVIRGLKDQQKNLMPKYFYDDAGSKYFDEICNLKEYYPYRTELSLLDTVTKDLSQHIKTPTTVVEFGAGSLKKIQPLIQNIKNITKFIPIDICGEHLMGATQTLKQAFPHVNINPIEADFTTPVELNTTSENCLGFFPGSTIGNFTPEGALDFLQNARATLGKNSHLLIGVDTKKSPDILHSAYNDDKGITAKFNLNVLNRINRELNTAIDTTKFEHYAHYNPQKGCIQMHLICTESQQCLIHDEIVTFNAGESIHTENSYKYTPDEFTQLAKLAGWNTQSTWLAPDNMFSTFLLQNTHQ